MAEDRRSGFMLLEVLVAAVVAVVLLAMVTRLAGDNGFRLETMKGRTGGMAVARSVIEEAGARALIAPGEHRGMAGDYAWTLAVTSLGPVQPAPPRGDDAPQGTDAAATAGAGGQAPAGEPLKPKWILYRLEVLVVSPDGHRSALGTFRLGPIGS